MPEVHQYTGEDNNTKPSHSSIAGAATNDWIQETITAIANDTRRQPWKKTFADSVDSGFDDGEDLVRLMKSSGGVSDPSCPFQIQGSSLAA